jgi:hypothetical protein
MFCRPKTKTLSFPHQVTGPTGLENLEYGLRYPSRSPRGTFHPQKLTQTLLTSGGRSVGIHGTKACPHGTDPRYKKLTALVGVRELTIPTERPPLVGEVIANFCGYRVPRGQRDGSLRPYSRFSRQEPLLFYQVAPQLDPRYFTAQCNIRLNALHPPSRINILTL